MKKCAKLRQARKDRARLLDSLYAGGFESIDLPGLAKIGEAELTLRANHVNLKTLTVPLAVWAVAKLKGRAYAKRLVNACRKVGELHLSINEEAALKDALTM